MSVDFTRIIDSEARMEAFGRCLGSLFTAPLIVYTHGPLGAGKTTLIRGVLHGLGHEGAVTSPTYTLIEPYSLPEFTVYHLDLYRLESVDELESLGFRDCLHDTSILLIEWPEKARAGLPPADIDLYLDYVDQGRAVAIGLNSTKIDLVDLEKQL